jgi:hypothetical protein
LIREEMRRTAHCSLSASPHHPLPFEFAWRAEIDEHSEFNASRLQIVKELRFFTRGESAERLDFDDDRPVNDEVSD